MGGVRCDLCSNGPCRSDAHQDKRGVCGITADGIAMRMMPLRNVLGASTYHYHAEQTVSTLRAAAGGKAPFGIREVGKLRAFDSRLGLDGDLPPQDLAGRLCNLVDEDFQRKTHEPSHIL